MKTLKAFIIIISLFGNAYAEVSNQQIVVNNANQKYSSGEYAAAAELYEQVIREGHESAGLYFNLGNSYFKLNNIPAAILFFEKARKLDPTDENILFNLELANSRIIDKIEPLPEFFLRSWFIAVRNLFPTDQWAWIGIAVFILLLAALLVFIVSRYILVRKLAFYGGIIFFVMMIISFIMSYSGYREYAKQNTAIVFIPTVTVKSSPTDQSVDLFVIHEGTKLFITDQIEGWSEIRLANGNVGWVKKEIYRPI